MIVAAVQGDVDGEAKGAHCTLRLGAFFSVLVEPDNVVMYAVDHLSTIHGIEPEVHPTVVQPTFPVLQFAAPLQVSLDLLNAPCFRSPPSRIIVPHRTHNVAFWIDGHSEQRRFDTVAQLFIRVVLKRVPKSLKSHQSLFQGRANWNVGSLKNDHGFCSDPTCRYVFSSNPVGVDFELTNANSRGSMLSEKQRLPLPSSSG